MKKNVVVGMKTQEEMHKAHIEAVYTWALANDYTKEEVDEMDMFRFKQLEMDMNLDNLLEDVRKIDIKQAEKFEKEIYDIRWNSFNSDYDSLEIVEVHMEEYLRKIKTNKGESVVKNNNDAVKNVIDTVKDSINVAANKIKAEQKFIFF
jgi:hypothetical protein